VAVKAPSGSWYCGSTYGYDNASRLSTATFNGATVTYGYTPTSARKCVARMVAAYRKGGKRFCLHAKVRYLPAGFRLIKTLSR
jgi:hypothetical protein